MSSDPAADFLERRARVYESRLQLRPLQTGELTDQAARLSRRHGALLIRLTALPALFGFVVMAFLMAFVFTRLFTTSNPDNMQTQAAEVVGVILFAAFVGGPLLMIGISLMAGLCASVVGDFVRGELPEEARSWKRVRESGGRLVWSQTLILLRSSWILILAIGCLLLSALVSDDQGSSIAWEAVPAVLGVLGLVASVFVVPLMVTRAALTPSILIFEQLKAREAIRRSRALLKASPPHPSGDGAFGQAWLMVIVVYGLIAFGVYAALDLIEAQRLIGQWLPAGIYRDSVNQLVALLPHFFGLWLAAVMWSATTTLIYFDRRIRLEAYDIEILASDAATRSRTSRFLP